MYSRYCTIGNGISRKVNFRRWPAKIKLTGPKIKLTEPKIKLTGPKIKLTGPKIN